MSAKILTENKLTDLEMRNVYANTLIELSKENEKIVALEADLMGAISMKSFMNERREQFINCGIMEANMVGVSCGMSLVGFVPFMHTFGPFATRRCFDQIFLSAAYAGLNLKIIGSDAGVSASHNGGTHMPFEDIALMRAVPEATVIEVSDTIMFEDLIKQVSEIHGVHYLRIVRKKMRQLYEEGSTFEIGKGIVLKDGTDVTIVATGIMIDEALKAHEILKEKGISAAVIDMFTIKPIDEELLIEYAKKTKFVVTAENHNIIGGLGSAVSEVLSEKCPTLLKRVGVNDRFGQVGEQEFLQEEYGLTAENIVKTVLSQM